MKLIKGKIYPVLGLGDDLPVSGKLIGVAMAKKLYYGIRFVFELVDPVGYKYVATNADISIATITTVPEEVADYHIVFPVTHMGNNLKKLKPVKDPKIDQSVLSFIEPTWED